MTVLRPWAEIRRLRRVRGRLETALARAGADLAGVRQLAREQQDEIRRLRAEVRQRPAPGRIVRPMTDAMGGDLAAKAGAAFDKAFLADMIAHHEAAITMARLAVTRAEHPQLKQLADGIIRAQTAEVGQMQDWQQDWQHPDRT